MNNAIISQSVLYEETKPSGPLADFVDCYWTIVSTGPLPTQVRNRILPDGCLDIIFANHGSLGLEQCEGASRSLPQAFLVGPMKTANIALLEGDVRIWGIRFKPCGARAFLQFPIEEVTDQHLSLIDVWKSAFRLGELLLGDLDQASQVFRIESFLLHYKTDRAGTPAWLPAAIQQIRQADGLISISQLAGAAKVSSRQMERQFRNHIGLSPKRYCRIMRLQRLLPRLRTPQEPTWADLAVLSGFYDQAHLVHECKALAGVTPRKLWCERSQVGFLQYLKPG